jgi:hypothetical protein
MRILTHIEKLLKKFLPYKVKKPKRRATTKGASRSMRSNQKLRNATNAVSSAPAKQDGTLYWMDM